MKKILFLFLLAGVFTLNSCSNDDDNGTSPGDDPIIGTWVLVDITPSGFIDPMACEQNSTLTFNEDETGSASFYLEQNDCEEASASGSWENTEDSNYTVELPQPIGRQQGEVEFEGADRFHFTTNILTTTISLTFDRQE